MYKYFSSASILVLCLSLTVLAQDVDRGQRKVSDVEVHELTKKISEIVERCYISEAVGKQMAAYIAQQTKNDAYFDLTLNDFKKAIQADLRKISSDKHMSLSISPINKTPQDSGLSNKNSEYGEQSNFGHTKIELLKDNIGYLNISHFTQPQFFSQAKLAVDRSMRTLANQNAIIIDLRDNPGGFEEIVAYLVSYFVDGEAQLQRYYCRYLNRERQIKVSNDLPEKKLLGVPIYILVSRNTGSAAESFAYIMKHLKRATIVGEVTVGGGNGANVFRISDELTLQVATWETINAVTKTSWEKRGVIPEIKSSNDDALEKTIELAVSSANLYRAELSRKHASALEDLNEVLESNGSMVETNILLERLDNCLKMGLVGEEQINWLGYQLIDDAAKLHLAEAVMEANAGYYPDSANAYDSWGDALMKRQKFIEAAQCFRKAVELGEKTGDQYLSIFKTNLEKALALAPKERSVNAESSGPDTEIEAIRQVLEQYIEGTANGNPSQLEQAFHPDFNLYFVDGNELRVWSGKKYIENFGIGNKRNRISKIVAIDRENDAAQAKVEIKMPDRNRIYTDYFLLLKINGFWKIIHKSFSYKSMDN